MELHNNDEPVYVISVVSDLLEIHPQTLRMYERIGLIRPQRIKLQRMYSLKDLDDIKEIRRLTREEGVNLAGVSIIIKMRRESIQLKRDIEELRERQ